MKMMVEDIRKIESALGSFEKSLSDTEIKNRNVARKSIVAVKQIAKGEVLTVNNITTKRPGCGVSPMKWNDILGTRAIRNFDKDELIEL